MLCGPYDRKITKAEFFGKIYVYTQYTQLAEKIEINLIWAQKPPPLCSRR